MFVNDKSSRELRNDYAAWTNLAAATREAAGWEWLDGGRALVVEIHKGIVKVLADIEDAIKRSEEVEADMDAAVAYMDAYFDGALLPNVATSGGIVGK